MLYYVLTYFFIIVCFLSGLVSSRGRTVCACHLHTMRDSPLSHIKQSQLRLLRATIVGNKTKNAYNDFLVVLRSPRRRVGNADRKETIGNVRLRIGRKKSRIFSIHTYIGVKVSNLYINIYI